MHLFHKNALLTLFVSLALMACETKETTKVVITSNANFVSLRLSNDTFPNLYNTVFSVDSIIIDPSSNEKKYTITNKDSLDYGTRINYVKTNFRFISSSGQVLNYADRSKQPVALVDSLLKGNEVFDFTNIFYITNTASDKVSKKKYHFNIVTHRVEPELYQWFRINPQVDNHNILSQKAVFFNGKIFYYRNDGSNAYLDTTTYGANVGSVTVSGLPVNSPLNDMTVHNGQLFLTRDSGNIYSSTDGFTWTKKTVDSFNFKSLIYSFGGKLWATIKSADSKYRFANSTDGTIWIERGELPSNYPVSDFASLSYNARNGAQKGIVIGGLDKSGNQLRTNWSTENGYKLVNFSQENSTLDSLDLGASIISYDNKLLIIGAIKNSSGPLKNFYRVSADEGLSWQRIDTELNELRDTKVPTLYYSPRKHQSVLVDANKKIYILGGKDNTTSYSDIWTGKLNRLCFDKQK